MPRDYSHETKLTEKLLQSGLTVVGLFIIATIVSAFCWVIVKIWNSIL